MTDYEWHSYIVSIPIGEPRPETTPIFLAIARSEGEAERRLCEDVWGSRLVDVHGRAINGTDS